MGVTTLVFIPQGHQSHKFQNVCQWGNLVLCSGTKPGFLCQSMYMHTDIHACIHVSTPHTYTQHWNITHTHTHTHTKPSGKGDGWQFWVSQSTRRSQKLYELSSVNNHLGLIKNLQKSTISCCFSVFMASSQPFPHHLFLEKILKMIICNHAENNFASWP